MSLYKLNPKRYDEKYRRDSVGQRIAKFEMPRCAVPVVLFRQRKLLNYYGNNIYSGRGSPIGAND